MYLLESELSSLIEDERVRSLLEPELLNDDTYYFYLNDLELALADTLAESRYLIPRSVGSAGSLSIDDTITEFLGSLESNFLLNFRMKPESFSLSFLNKEAMITGVSSLWGRLVAVLGGQSFSQQVAVTLYVLGSASGLLENKEAAQCSQGGQGIP